MALSRAASEELTVSKGSMTYTRTPLEGSDCVLLCLPMLGWLVDATGACLSKASPTDGSSLWRSALLKLP